MRSGGYRGLSSQTIIDALRLLAGQPATPHHAGLGIIHLGHGKGRTAMSDQTGRVTHGRDAHGQPVSMQRDIGRSRFVMDGIR